MMNSYGPFWLLSLWETWWECTITIVLAIIALQGWCFICWLAAKRVYVDWCWRKLCKDIHFCFIMPARDSKYTEEREYTILGTQMLMKS